MGRIPDRWQKYIRIGRKILGTRFICFKVPLSKAVNETQKIPVDEMLYPALLPELIPDLGLVIDLTDTTKYYSPQDILSLGIEYCKINVRGQQVPHNKNFKDFQSTVDTFLKANADNDKLIGVHCTHGLNRSGYLVCRYMVSVLNMPASEAFEKFETARGHKMERTNYLDDIRKREIRNVPSIAIDTDTNKGTQCDPGFWIDTKLIKGHSSPDSETGLNMQLLSTNEPRQSVSLRGYVNIREKHLIPDSNGGYFVHIEQRDIERFKPREGDANHRRLPPSNLSHQNRPNSTQNDQFMFINQQRPFQPSPPNNRYGGRPMSYRDHENYYQSSFGSQSTHGPRTDKRIDQRKRNYSHVNWRTESLDNHNAKSNQ